MFRYVLSPPATESNKGMHTSGKSSKTRANPGLKTQYAQVIKNQQSLLLSPDSRCLLTKLGQSMTSWLIGSGQPNHPSRRSPGRRSVLDPTGDLSHQDPILLQHRMQRTANMLGLNVTAESKKNYIKKSCVVDKQENGQLGRNKL